MTFPVANIPLDIWSMAPTKYLYTNTIQDSSEFTIGLVANDPPLTGSFEFTKERILRTANGVTTPLSPQFGRLPNATELGSAPYYTMIVFPAFDQGAQVGSECYFEVTGSDGSLVRDYGGPAAAAGERGVNLPPFWAFKVPSTTTSVRFNFTLATSTADQSVTIGACYAIPSVPENGSGQRLSATDLLRYELAPVVPVLTSAPTQVLTLAPGVSNNAAVLPTAAELNGAPWYYVAMNFSAIDPSATSSMLNRIYWAANMVDPATGIDERAPVQSSHCINYGTSNALAIRQRAGRFQYVPRGVGRSGTFGCFAEEEGNNGTGIVYPADSKLLKFSAADTNTLTFLSSNERAAVTLRLTYYIPVLPETA